MLIVGNLQRRVVKEFGMIGPHAGGIRIDIEEMVKRLQAQAG